LIITEASQVSPQGVGYPFTPGIHNDAQVAAWKSITDTVHREGGRIFLQLWHVGRISHRSLQPDNAQPVAPSALQPEGHVYTYDGPKPFETPRALALNEIPAIIDQFRVGAEHALRAGFDGVEIHGANGYLLDQFLRDGTNRRTDAYGGSLENRARLMLEVTRAVSSVWGADRVGVRLSPLNSYNDMRDSNPEATFGYVADKLSDFGLAYLHVTESGSQTAGAAGPAFDPGILRHTYRGVYMTNGGYSLERANQTLAEGKADIIAFGALFLANPDLPVRFASRAALNAPDPSTFYGGDAKGYTDYPALRS
jgi:N-ethylmaleimide reductase